MSHTVSIFQLPDDLIRELTENWMQNPEIVVKFDTSMCCNNEFANRDLLLKGHCLAQPNTMTSGFLRWIRLRKSVCPLLEFGKGNAAVESQLLTTLNNCDLCRDDMDYLLSNVVTMTIISNSISRIVRWLEVVNRHCVKLTNFRVQCLDTTFLQSFLSDHDPHMWKSLNSSICGILTNNSAHLINVVVDMPEYMVGFDRHNFDTALGLCTQLTSTELRIRVDFCKISTGRDTPQKARLMGSALLRVLERMILELEAAERSDFYMRSEALCLQTDDEEVALFYMKHHFAYIKHSMVQVQILIDGRLSHKFDADTFQSGGFICSTRTGTFETGHHLAAGLMTTPLTMTCLDCLMYPAQNIALVSL